MAKAGFWEKVGAFFSDVWAVTTGGMKVEEKYARDEGEKYKTKLKEINSRYNLKLTSYVIDNASNNYGYYKSKEHYGDEISLELKYDSNLSAGANFLENIIGNSSSFTKSTIENYSFDKVSKTFDIQKKIRLEKKNKGESLTQILMKDPFAIFANGSLYKKGRPGTKSYDPLTPYEPYKYITGDITYNEFDDILMGRSHFKLAGNKDYFSNVWEEPNWMMPDQSRKNRHLMAYISARNEQMYRGFQEINKLGWVANEGIGLTNEYKSLNNLNYYYSQALKEQMPQFFDISKYSQGANNE